jgi:hypothetical protein
MAEAAKANPNPTAETFAAPKADPTKDLAPDVAARIAEQARTGNVRTGPNATPDTTVNGERPTWLPEKFKTPEDMAKAYGELEKKQSTTPAKEPVKGTEPAKIGDLALPEGGEVPTDPAAVAKAAADAGIDMDALEQEYAQHGDITPESRAKLAKKGYTQRHVDNYIAGQKAIAAQILTDLQVSVAGSREKFDAMWAWSVRGIPDGEKAAINAALATNDPNVAKLAMSAVHAKWIAAVGQDPERVVHGTQGGANSEVYSHMDELHADMRKPEYKTSEGFRQKVVEKLKRSNI